MFPRRSIRLDGGLIIRPSITAHGSHGTRKPLKSRLALWSGGTFLFAASFGHNLPCVSDLPRKWTGLGDIFGDSTLSLTGHPRKTHVQVTILISQESRQMENRGRMHERSLP